MDSAAWVRHFERNVDVQRAMEAQVDWDAPSTLDARRRQAFMRSFQRFELGERGAGEHLLTRRELVDDEPYARALALLVAEEQRHSELFGRGLRYLGGGSLSTHWSDTAFTALRRALGLRTELGIFLVAECVAMDYFTALATAAPDPVLRAIGRRLEHDEHDHLRFQVDRLGPAFASAPALLRRAVRALLLVVGVGAAVVLAGDHRAALRACDRRPFGYARGAVRTLRHHLDLALVGEPHPLGPRPAPVRAAAGAGDERE